jgi:hypothetical protein
MPGNIKECISEVRAFMTHILLLNNVRVMARMITKVLDRYVTSNDSLKVCGSGYSLY